MKDENRNGIPDGWDRIIALIMTIAGTVCGVCIHSIKPTPLWATIGQEVAFLVLALFGVGLARKGVGRVAPLVGVILLALCLSCTPTKRRTIVAATALGARNAGDEVDKAMGATTRAKTAECLKAHGTKTKGFNECIKAFRVHRERWRLHARPGLNAMITTMYHSILASKEAGTSAKELLKMGKALVCAVAKATSEFNHLFPKDWKDRVSMAIGMTKGVTCQ